MVRLRAFNFCDIKYCVLFLECKVYIYLAAGERACDTGDRSGGSHRGQGVRPRGPGEL